MPVLTDQPLVDLSPGQRLPWWAYALDFLALGGAAIAVLAAVGLGPRFRVGPVIVSLLTPLRPLAWAAGAALFRHALVRRPTVVQQVTAWQSAILAGIARTLARYPSVRAALGPFVVSRLSVVLVGFFAVGLIGYPNTDAPWRWSTNDLLNLPAKWDASHYRGIARFGYEWTGRISQDSHLTFFPAYPLAARVVGWPLGSAEAGLFVVVFLSFFWALTYVFRLARAHLDEDGARWALLFLAFYPFAAFYSADYTEAMFLLTAAGTFYHHDRGEWLKATAWGVLTGLTRPNGFLLSVALGVGVLETAWRAERANRSDPVPWRRLGIGAAVACGPILGATAHSAYVYSLTGDPLMWVRMQAAWQRSYQSPLAMLDWMGRVIRLGLYHYSRYWTIDFLNSAAALFALVGIWPVVRRFGLAYGAFIAVNLIPPLLTGGSLSVGRFTSTLFPIFLWLGAAVPAARRTSWLAMSASLQALVAVVFFTWRPLN